MLEDSLETWEPFQTVARLRILAPRWMNMLRSGFDPKTDEGLEALRLLTSYRTALTRMMSIALEWRIDSKAVETFAEIDTYAEHPELMTRYSALMHFLWKCAAEAPARWKTYKSSVVSPDGIEDGPVAPCQLRFGNQMIDVQPIPWKLLNYCWRHRNTREQDAIDAVWGHDSDASDRAVKTAICRANRALMEVACPISLSRKAGQITLS